jgi:hypothetical protein
VIAPEPPSGEADGAAERAAVAERAEVADGPDVGIISGVKVGTIPDVVEPQPATAAAATTRKKVSRIDLARPRIPRASSRQRASPQMGAPRPAYPVVSRSARPLQAAQVAVGYDPPMRNRLRAGRS